MSFSSSLCRVLATGVCALTLVGIAPLASAETIRLVQDEAYAPYMSKDGKAATGIWATVIQEALSRTEGSYDVEIEALPWSRAVNLVEAGQAHGLVGTYYRPESRPWIGAYSVAPFTEKVSVYCRDGVGEESWSYPQDFAGLTFGNNTGYGTPGEAFFEMVANGSITVQEAPATDLNLKKLQAGRVDCYVQEQLTVEMVINAQGLSGFRRVLDTTVEDSMIGFRGTWEGAEAESFIAALNTAFEAMIVDGSIDAIISSAVGK